MLGYDENSDTYLQQDMVTFEESVLHGNPLQRSRFGPNPEPEPNPQFENFQNPSAGIICIVCHHVHRNASEHGAS